MEDLSDFFELALSRKARWSNSMFSNLLTKLGDTPGISVDWDDGAGEDWAAAFKNRELIVSVCRVVPVIIIRNTDQVALSAMYDQSVLVTIVVEDFYAPIYSLDRVLIGKIFQRTYGPDELDGICAKDIAISTI